VSATATRGRADLRSQQAVPALAHARWQTSQGLPQQQSAHQSHQPLQQRPFTQVLGRHDLAPGHPDPFAASGRGLQADAGRSLHQQFQNQFGVAGMGAAAGAHGGRGLGLVAGPMGFLGTGWGWTPGSGALPGGELRGDLTTIAGAGGWDLSGPSWGALQPQNVSHSVTRAQSQSVSHSEAQSLRPGQARSLLDVDHSLSHAGRHSPSPSCVLPRSATTLCCHVPRALSTPAPCPLPPRAAASGLLLLAHWLS